MTYTHSPLYSMATHPQMTVTYNSKYNLNANGCHSDYLWNNLFMLRCIIFPKYFWSVGAGRGWGAQPVAVETLWPSVCSAPKSGRRGWHPPCAFPRYSKMKGLLKPMAACFNTDTPGWRVALGGLVLPLQLNDTSPRAGYGHSSTSEFYFNPLSQCGLNTELDQASSRTETQTVKGKEISDSPRHPSPRQSESIGNQVKTKTISWVALKKMPLGYAEQWPFQDAEVSLESTCQPLSLCHSEEAVSLGYCPKESLGPGCRKVFKRGLRLGGEGVSFFATQSLPKEYLKAVSISVCYTEAFEKIPMSQREWSSGKNITPFFVVVVAQCCCYWVSMCPYQIQGFRLWL